MPVPAFRREPVMTENKNRRIASAIAFLSGVLACLDAIRDTRVLWPPDALWNALRHPQRLELGGGLALIGVAIVTKIVAQNV